MTTAHLTNRAAQELIAEGRKQEALRMTRSALTLRFGGLEHQLSLALENLDTTALEAIAFDSGLSLEQLHARLGRHEACPLPRRGGIRGSQGKPARLSPLGGYRG